MDKKIERYVENVMSHISADQIMKKRLAEDLKAHIASASEQRDTEDVLEKMGRPEEMAEELMDTLYQDKKDVIQELVRTKAEIKRFFCYEYKSEKTLLGIPLVHINLSRGRGGIRAAKGIIAIGDISFGLVSLGGLSLGGISVGGVSAGFLGAIGGVAAGSLFALGGVAVGGLALGGLAIGRYAFGGCAIASRIAMGGYAKGVVAVGGKAVGTHTISTGGTELDMVKITAAQVKSLIAKEYPDLWKPLVKIFTVWYK